VGLAGNEHADNSVWSKYDQNTLEPSLKYNGSMIKYGIF